MFSTKFPVGIISMDRIRCKRLNSNLDQLLLQMNQSFKRTPLLKALKEKEAPSIRILLTLTPNSTNLVSLPLIMRQR